MFILICQEKLAMQHGNVQFIHFEVFLKAFLHYSFSFCPFVDLKAMQTNMYIDVQVGSQL